MIHIFGQPWKIAEQKELKCAAVDVITVLTDLEGKRKRVLNDYDTTEWSGENVEGIGGGRWGEESV